MATTVNLAFEPMGQGCATHLTPLAKAPFQLDVSVAQDQGVAVGQHLGNLHPHHATSRTASGISMFWNSSWQHHERTGGSKASAAKWMSGWVRLL